MVIWDISYGTEDSENQADGDKNGEIEPRRVGNSGLYLKTSTPFTKRASRMEHLDVDLWRTSRGEGLKTLADA